MAGPVQPESMFTAPEQTSRLSSASDTRPLSSSSSSSFDDESYFLKTYVPLSGLPTPPLSSYSAGSPYQASFDPIFLDERELLGEIPIFQMTLVYQANFILNSGPSILLKNLIPPCTSLMVVSMPIIYGILKRAHLSLNTISFAVIILDSLNSRFALMWRKKCPLVSSAGADRSEHVEDQHIDSLRPELIALASLIIAHKFLDHGQQTTDDFCEHWGNNLWTRKQVNFTQRALLENIGYRLFPLSKDSIISTTLRDMERAGAQYT